MGWMDKRKGYLLFFAFFSGFAALIYEVIWFRKIHLSFGVSSYALAIVLSTFLLGLVLGGYFGGKFIDRYSSLRKIAKIYAFVELFIGIFALLVPFGLSVITPVLAFFYQQEFGSFTFNFVKFLLTSMILLVPSFFIGATFPIIFKLYTEKRVEIKKGVSLLYFVNTLGGVFGVFLAGFFLIRLYGMNFAMGVAAVLNFIIFILAFSLSKKYVGEVEGESDTFYGKYTKELKLLLLLFFASGFTALAYEVIWGRMFTLYSYGTIYATSLLLSMFLFGIAIGSFVYSKYFKEAKIIYFVYLELIIASFAVIGYWLFSVFMRTGIQGFEVNLFGLFLLSVVMVFIPALGFGIIFPLVNNYVLDKSRKLGSSIGRIYAINTTGAILGAIFAGLVLVPAFGLKGSIFLISVLSLCIAGVALFVLVNPRKKDLVYFGAAIVIVFFIFVNVPSQFLVGPLREEIDVLYYEHGSSATISVLGQGGFRRLYVDNQEVAATLPVVFMDSKVLAHIPLLIHPNPKNALTVGFGSGGTSYSMLRHDLDYVDVVEIEKKVVEAEDLFVVANHGITSNEKLNVIFEDARSHLALTDKKYDVISTDVTNLQYYSNSNLYTKEYFELMKSKLNDGGIASAWVPLPDTSEREQKILMRTFQEVFPHTYVWVLYNKFSPFFVYVGTQEELNIDYENFNSRFVGEVEADLREVGLIKYNLLNSMFLDEVGVRKYVGEGEIHTDNNPVLEFPIIRRTADSNTIIGQNMVAIFDRKVDPLPYISGMDDVSLREFRYEQEEVAENLINGYKALIDDDHSGAARYFKEAIENADYLDTVDLN